MLVIHSMIHFFKLKPQILIFSAETSDYQKNQFLKSRKKACREERICIP